MAETEILNDLKCQAISEEENEIVTGHDLEVSVPVKQETKTVTAPDLKMETEQISNDEDEIEDVPDDFFDDFSNVDFMAGLDVVDTWVSETEEKDCQDNKISVRNIDGKSFADVVKSNDDKSSKIPNKKSCSQDRYNDSNFQRRYAGQNNSRIYRSRRENSKEESQEMLFKKDISPELGSRRDPNKTKRDIQRDKDRKLKEKEARAIQERLKIVNTGLVPPGTELEIGEKPMAKDATAEVKIKKSPVLQMSPVRRRSLSKPKLQKPIGKFEHVTKHNDRAIIRRKSPPSRYEEKYERSRGRVNRSRSYDRYNKDRIRERRSSREFRYRRSPSYDRRERSLEKLTRSIERFKEEYVIRGRNSRSKGRISGKHRSRSRSFYRRSRSRDSRSWNRGYFDKKELERYSTVRHSRSRKGTPDTDVRLRELSRELSLSPISANRDNRHSSYSSSIEDFKETYKKQRSPFIIELERKFKRASEERRLLNAINKTTYNETPNQIQNQPFYEHVQQFKPHAEYLPNHMVHCGPYVPDGQMVQYGQHGPIGLDNPMGHGGSIMHGCPMVPDGVINHVDHTGSGSHISHLIPIRDVGHHMNVESSDNQQFVAHNTPTSYVSQPQICSTLQTPQHTTPEMCIPPEMCPAPKISPVSESYEPSPRSSKVSSQNLDVRVKQQNKISPKKRSESLEPNIKQLFAEKKISLSDFLTVSSKGLESTDNMPVPTLKKIKVISRVEDAILKLDNFDNKKSSSFLFKNPIYILSEVENAALNCRSPLRRVSHTTRIHFTTPVLTEVNVSPRIQRIMTALDMKTLHNTQKPAAANIERMSGVELVNDQSEIIYLSDISVTPPPPTISINRPSEFNSRKKYATSIAIQTDLSCKKCEDKKSVTFRDMGSQTDLKKVSVGTLVNEKFLKNSCTDQVSLSHLTPAQLLKTNKNKSRRKKSNNSPNSFGRPLVNVKSPNNSPAISLMARANFGSNRNSFANNSPCNDFGVNTDSFDFNNSNYGNMNQHQNMGIIGNTNFDIGNMNPNFGNALLDGNNWNANTNFGNMNPIQNMGDFGNINPNFGNANPLVVNPWNTNSSFDNMNPNANLGGNCFPNTNFGKWNPSNNSGPIPKRQKR